MCWYLGYSYYLRVRPSPPSADLFFFSSRFGSVGWPFFARADRLFLVVLSMFSKEGSLNVKAT